VQNSAPKSQTSNLHPNVQTWQEQKSKKIKIFTS
jgi:hypothetical protein